MKSKLVIYKYIIDKAANLFLAGPAFVKAASGQNIDAETLGGLFISKFGVLPKIGDKIKIENVSIEVLDTNARRIKTFKVSKNI